MDTDRDFSYKRDTIQKHQNKSLTTSQHKYNLREAKLQRILQILNFWVWPSMFQGTPMCTFRKSYERVIELIRNKYVPIPESSWQFSWTNTMFSLLTLNGYWWLLEWIS